MPTKENPLLGFGTDVLNSLDIPKKPPKFMEDNPKILMLVSLAVVAVVAVVAYFIKGDPKPSTYDAGNGAGDILFTTCTDTMKNTCYPCDPIPELAGSTSTPSPHRNPQCGVNRMNGEYGICKPGISFSSPMDMGWDKNPGSPPPDNEVYNQCYNCSGDDRIHDIINDNKYDMNFFCDLEEPCGDYINPSEAGETFQISDNKYPISYKTINI